MQISMFLKQELGDHLKRCSIGFNDTVLPKGIIIADENTAPREGHLCIVSSGSIKSFKTSSNPINNCYFFLTKGAEVLYEKLAQRSETAVYATDLDCVPLYNLLYTAMLHSGSSETNLSPGGNDFANFIHDVLRTRLVYDNEIYHAYRELPNTADMSFRVLIFEFEERQATAANFGMLSRRLKAIFRNINCTNYFGRFVAIQQADDWSDDNIHFSNEVFNQLEEACTLTRCYASIGCPCLNWQMLRTQIHMVTSTLRIALRMKQNTKTHLFYAEDYMLHLTLNWAFKGYSEEYMHENYMYMLYPGVAQIIRYDQENDSDLRDVLLQYLLNERNATKTADALFMHRNTVLYKIKKIESLLVDDLEDPVARERILWSCRMSEFCEKVLHISPDQFKGYGSSERFPITPKSRK